jgi:formiminoglutamate deiminase
MRPYPARQTFWCDLALLPGGRVTDGVTVEVDGGSIIGITEGSPATSGAQHLPGLVIPGLANSHSRAFHRALRGRTQAPTGGRGSFWTWRELMYSVAERLTPDSYLTLARAVYAEMAMAGITTVGEFHYLHHGADGRAYADPNAMGHALVQAARDAGLRIALLDTCYLAGGFDRPLEGVQLRFDDGDAQGWAARATELATAYDGAADVVVGAAIHSVRAVPVDQLAPVAGWAAARQAPLHMHLSEQRAENDACHDRHGVTPTRLLHDHGALGPRSSAVHATHLVDEDVALLAGSATAVCLCPTTERDLADGIGPSLALRDAGVELTLGSDSHAVIDLFEEARGVELDSRLATEARGHFDGASLLATATDGHARLGFASAGRLAVGAPADLVAVRLDSVRTSGALPETALDTVVFAATAADVTDVVAGGRHVVEAGRHVLGDVGLLLRNAIHDVV